MSPLLSLSVSLSTHTHTHTHTAIPLSMLRLTRVKLRQRLGPARIGALDSLGLPPHIVDFMQNILGLCDGSAFRAMAVKAGSAQIQLKALNPEPHVGLLPAKPGQ